MSKISERKFIYKVVLVVICFLFATGLFGCSTDVAALRERVNEITVHKMSANVMVENKCVLNNASSSALNSVTTTQGSGVIIKSVWATIGKQDTYYCLTNCHVVQQTSTWCTQTFTVYDYLGRSYPAWLMAFSDDYDLALLKFYITEDKLSLTAVEFAENDPAVFSNVFALGQPHGQRNALSVGSVYGIDNPPETENESSNIKFPVIKHDAYISNGSSGGALLDYDLKLAGVNYAGSVDGDDNFVFAYAVPVSRVKEFLSIHNFEI